MIAIKQILVIIPRLTNNMIALSTIFIHGRILCLGIEPPVTLYSASSSFDSAVGIKGNSNSTINRIYIILNIKKTSFFSLCYLEIIIPYFLLFFKHFFKKIRAIQLSPNCSYLLPPRVEYRVSFLPIVEESVAKTSFVNHSLYLVVIISKVTVVTGHKFPTTVT